MEKRALLIANRNSRQCAELFEPACDALRQRGFVLTIPTLKDRETTPDIIRQHSPQHDLIIVMGGDGSINASLPGVIDSGLPLGILPAGTANDLARTLKLPTEMDAAAGVIAKGNTRSIDVAEVNDVPFLNAASLGMSVDVTRQLDKDFKKRWGKLAYVLASGKSLFRAPGFTAHIQSRGKSVSVRTKQIVVGNGVYFGTGMTVDESAEIDDGVLHLYAVKSVPWWRVLSLVPALRFGTHAKSDAVVNVTTDELTITTPRPRTIAADGEILTQTPARFVVRSRAIRIFTND